MKKTILLGALSLSILGIGNLHAQSPFKSLLAQIKTEKNDLKGKFILPQAGLNHAQKPVLGSAKLQSVIYSEIDSNNDYTPLDSTAFIWDKDRHQNFDGGVLIYNSLSFHDWIEYDDEVIFKIVEKPDYDYILYQSPINADSMHIFTYDPTTNTYLDESKLTYNIFDVNGNVAETIERTISPNSSSQILYEYNSMGQITKQTHLDSTSNGWENVELHEFAFDANGNMIEYIDQYWDNLINQWEIEKKLEFEYDQNDKWISETISDRFQSAALELREKRTFEYNSNDVRTKETIELWENGAWENSMAVEFTLNNNDEITEIILKEWDNAWEDVANIAFEYDALGNQSKMNIQLFHLNNWITYMTNDYEFNNDNLSLITQSLYDETSDSLIEYAKYNFEHNNDHQLISYSESNFNGTNWMDPEFKLNFNYEKETSISKKDKNIDFGIYPNPAQNQLTIQAGKEQITQVMITDISGKTMMSQQSNGQSQMNISTDHLPNGMYMIHIAGKDFTGTKTFVVQK